VTGPLRADLSDIAFGVPGVISGKAQRRRSRGIAHVLGSTLLEATQVQNFDHRLSALRTRWVIREPRPTNFPDLPLHLRTLA